MKKSSKIILTIVIILIIAAVVGGVLLSFSNLKKSNDKINELQNKIVDLKEGNKINNEENSNKSIESIIQKMRNKHLIQTILKIKIADNSYLIHVEYEPDESGSKSTYFFVTYKNGQVTLKKQLY